MRMKASWRIEVGVHLQVHAIWPTGTGADATRACSRTLGQSIRRACPLISSTGDVQLFTQSP